MAMPSLILCQKSRSLRAIRLKYNRERSYFAVGHWLLAVVAPAAEACPLSLIEVDDRCRLLHAHPPSRDVRHDVILAAHLAPGQTAQHGELAHVRQRIGNRPLEELLRRNAQRNAGAQPPVECL